MELYQEKFFLCIEYLALFIAFAIGIITISLFYQNIYIVLLLLIIDGLMAFPILFCYPKKIFAYDDKITIFTKIYKHEILPKHIIYVKKHALVVVQHLN